ncbi:MAG: YbbR-like domain-containing protein [Oscillospiraceae bacterium]|jgi:YbbR domain-containing protein
MKKIAAVRKITDSRLFWAIISILISVFLWMYVTASQGEDYRDTFQGVKVEFQGEEALREGKGLIVTEVDTTSVTVVLSGSRREISKLSSANLSAVIDLSSINSSGVNKFSYTIRYPEGIDSRNITVASVSPAVITFTVDKLNSKTVEVRGIFEGSVAKGYVAEPMEFSPATVKISGPVKSLDKVEYALVVVERKDVDKTLTFESSYVLMDKDGNPVGDENIVLETDTVTVSLPVKATKEVSLAVDIIEGGGATTSNVICTFSPATITLAGDSEILDGINKIVVGTIDLSDIATSFRETYPIVIPNNVENLTGETEVTVNVEIRGLATKQMTVTNIEVKNVTDGYVAEIVTQSLEVTVRSTQAMLDLIASNNLRAVVDLKDIGNTVGRFTIPAKVYVDGFDETEAGAVGDYNVVVFVERR